MPLVQFPLGGFHRGVQVLLRQVEELLVVVLQRLGGGEFGGFAELGFGRFQQLGGGGRLFQLAVQSRDLGVEGGRFLQVGGLGIGGCLIVFGLEAGDGGLVLGSLGGQAAFGAEALYEPAARAAADNSDDDANNDADNPFHW